MRALTLILWTLTAGVAWSQPAPPSREEEVDLDALEAEEKFAAPRPAAATRVPEHEYDLRLLALPALLVGMLAWNVRWQAPSRAKR